uniref:Peptidase S1 domain-containing protein n=1 Tax=Daphnia galeata TaxID=27404 RepID=A0A8J2RW34_9CRUS|nr:unnamed protein product [Daphnia galeata]
MGLSSWAVALCFLAGLHSHPLTELVKFVGNHEQTLNGIPALSGDFPYLCVLHLNGYLCGGTLIGPSHILTAAHCLHGHAITEIGKFSAVLNSLAIDGSSTGAVIRGVKYFIIHEQYNPSYKDNDIAILILSSPVTNLSFATLPTDSTTKATTISATTTKTHATTPKPTTTKEKPTITETLKSQTDQQNITTKKANHENIFTSTSITKPSASTTAENTTSDSDLVPLSNIFSGLLAIKWTTTQRPTTKTTIMTTPHTTTTPISTNATPTAENLTSGSDLSDSDLVPLSNIFSSLLAIKWTTTQRPTTKTTIMTTPHTTTTPISTNATPTAENLTSASDLVPLSNIFSSLLAIKSTTTQRPTPKTNFTTTSHTTVNAISTVATTTAENPTTGSDLKPLSNIFSSLLAIKTTTTQTPATATKTTVTPNTKTPSKTSTPIIATTTAEGKPTSDNDLVPLSHFFSNASAISASSTFANSPAILAGWGTTSLGANLSKVLLKVDVIIRDNSFCKGRYDSSFIVADFLCASTSGTHNCQDMNGGPLFVNGVQVGITSWGTNGCADPNFAGIYTRVSNFLGWIATTKSQNP